MPRSYPGTRVSATSPAMVLELTLDLRVDRSVLVKVRMSEAGGLRVGRSGQKRALHRVDCLVTCRPPCEIPRSTRCFVAAVQRIEVAGAWTHLDAGDLTTEIGEVGSVI